MKKLFVMIAMMLAMLSLSGCGNRDNLSPFSPRAQMRQQLQNQNGKIGELETLNNAQKMELGKLQAQAEIHARDIQAMQQGNLNKANSGVQILQGDGVLIVILVLGAMAIGLAFYYHSRAAKSEKAAAILAQQISHADDPLLDERVCMAALNSDVEAEVYHLLTRYKTANRT